MGDSRMKCRKCGRPAAINMRRHKLALCEACYPAWFRGQVERTIRQFRMLSPDDRALVAVSGGKDSLTVWDVLLHLGYHAEGLYIDLGIPDGGYSTESEMRALRFAESRSATCHVVSIRDRYGLSVPELAAQHRRMEKACSLCGLVKRHVMNGFAWERGFSVLVTGHNLDDEAAVLMQNTLTWQPGYLARQFPVLPADAEGLVRKVKPLCLMYEREVAAYALVSGIDYIQDECPHAVGARTLFYKEILNRLEQRSPGAKAYFFTQFLRAKQGGHIRFAEDREVALHACSRCGQPTTAPGLCAFCRLWASDVQTSAGDEEEA